MFLSSKISPGDGEDFLKVWLQKNAINKQSNVRTLNEITKFNKVNSIANQVNVACLASS